MDHRVYRWFPWASKSLSPRGHALFETYQQLFQSSQNRLKLQFVGLLGAALILGFAGYSRSLNIAKEQWLRDHPPSLQTWVSLIQSRGYVEIPDSRWKDLLMDSAPMTRRNENQVWAIQPGNFLALSRPEGFFFFAPHRKPDSLPSLKMKFEWEALGKSWEGLDVVETRPIYSVTEKNEDSPKKARTHRIDPKRLTY
jgi:hypothetical protein